MLNERSDYILKGIHEILNKGSILSNLSDDVPTLVHY